MCARPPRCACCVQVWAFGKQIYVGAFDSEAQAGMMHDLVLLKAHSAGGTQHSHTNFVLDGHPALQAYKDALDTVSRPGRALLHLPRAPSSRVPARHPTAPQRCALAAASARSC